MIPVAYHNFKRWAEKNTFQTVGETNITTLEATRNDTVEEETLVNNITLPVSDTDMQDGDLVVRVWKLAFQLIWSERFFFIS